MPIITKHLLNREGWLTEIAKHLEPHFRDLSIAPYRVTCGWPCKNALGVRTRRVGECHGIDSSKGKVHEIFISPLLDDSLIVAGTLTHELAHVVAGIKAGHGVKYKSVCMHVGLTKGKPTQAMPGDLLNDKIRKIIDTVGIYPHQALTGVPKAKSTVARPSVKLICPCGCKITMSAKWVESVGIPTCACGEVFAGVKIDEGE